MILRRSFTKCLGNSTNVASWFFFHDLPHLRRRGQVLPKSEEVTKSEGLKSQVFLTTSPKSQKSVRGRSPKSSQVVPTFSFRSKTTKFDLRTVAGRRRIRRGAQGTTRRLRAGRAPIGTPQNNRWLMGHLVCPRMEMFDLIYTVYTVSNMTP